MFINKEKRKFLYFTNPKSLKKVVMIEIILNNRIIGIYRIKLTDIIENLEKYMDIIILKLAIYISNIH